MCKIFAVVLCYGYLLPVFTHLHYSPGWFDVFLYKSVITVSSRTLDWLRYHRHHHHHHQYFKSGLTNCYVHTCIEGEYMVYGLSDNMAMRNPKKFFACTLVNWTLLYLFIRILRFCAHRILCRIGQCGQNWPLWAELTMQKLWNFATIFRNIALSLALMAATASTKHFGVKAIQYFTVMCINAAVTGIAIYNCNKFSVYIRLIQYYGWRHDSGS